MTRAVRTAVRALRRFLADLRRRVRERGRTALLRALRISGATVAAFVAAELLGLSNPPPLVAALTALLVVQATLAATLVNGVQRVLSVVAGVALAVVVVSMVGLTWWSLGAIVATSIVVGQILRLGPHLLEVPISAMLVLGVGYTTGAEAVGAGRVVETLIGAAVGVLVNVTFPPAVQTRNVGRAVERFAAGIADLLDDAAAAMNRAMVEQADAARWLDDARRLNRHAPQLDAALAEAEESRRLNVRALGVPVAGRGLREGLDVLEHASVSMRALFRAVYDSTVERTGLEDPVYAAQVRAAAAGLLGDLAAVVRGFGRSIRAEIEIAADPREAELSRALDQLRRRRAAVVDLLIADPRGRNGLWELNSALLTTTDRALDELDAAGRARRQAAGDPARRRAVQAVDRLRATTRHLAERAERAGRLAARRDPAPGPEPDRTHD
ncbi:aromatic acid exporter family protein [Pseudonocardia sp. N23]|uniref:FUSC family protein n=1 Tax=Pseudonocardia sp. N23 TaxID=1987376 RepID=UPI000C033BBA|nr:FUSC family protein [Pseudonocardia sp. N23]GAY10420.1 integral membrane protein [Pseudonocardia sp. N23]